MKKNRIGKTKTLSKKVVEKCERLRNPKKFGLREAVLSFKRVSEFSDGEAK
jgi:hypothetical protein